MFFNIKSDGEALRAEERRFERFARMYTSISPSEKRAMVIYTSVMAKFRREWPVRQLTARRVIKNYADSINYTFEVTATATSCWSVFRSLLASKEQHRLIRT